MAGGVEWSAQEQTDAFRELMRRLISLPDQQAADEANLIRSSIPKRCVAAVFSVLRGSSLADMLVPPGTLLNELFVWLDRPGSDDGSKVARLDRVRVGLVPTHAVVAFNPCSVEPRAWLTISYENEFDFHTAYANVCLGVEMTRWEAPQTTRLSTVNTFSDAILETFVRDGTRAGRPEDIQAFVDIAEELHRQTG